LLQQDLAADERLACVGGVTKGTTRDLVVRFVTAHHKQRDSLAPVAIGNAAGAAFPCLQMSSVTMRNGRHS
jgi:hypothetical protein